VGGGNPADGQNKDLGKHQGDTQDPPRRHPGVTQEAGGGGEGGGAEADNGLGKRPGGAQEAPRRHPGSTQETSGRQEEEVEEKGRNPMDRQNKDLGRLPGGIQLPPSRNATNPGPHILRHFC